MFRKLYFEIKKKSTKIPNPSKMNEFFEYSPTDGDRVQRSLPVLSHFSMCIKSMPQAIRNNHRTSAKERCIKVTSFSNQTLNHRKVGKFVSYACTSTPFIRLRTHQLILGGGGGGGEGGIWNFRKNISALQNYEILPYLYMFILVRHIPKRITT